MKKELLVIIIIFLFIITGVASAFNINLVNESRYSYFGNWLYVGGNGPENYSRIQDAIDNATDGDIVFVYDDSSPYNESFSVDKSIILQGENMNTTIIHGRCSISSNYVIISDFMFQIYEIPGLSVEGFSNNIIENCIFSSSGGGLYLVESDNNILRNCSFIFCEYPALYIRHSNNNEVSYCDFFDCNDWMFGNPSITIGASREININHCNIARNNHGGVSVIASFVKMRSNNIFNNDGPGVILKLLSFCDMRNNWWGGPDGPNVTMYFSNFFEIHWGLGPVAIRKVDNGDSVIFTRPCSLIGINRIFPWFSEPVSDAGHHV